MATACRSGKEPQYVCTFEAEEAGDGSARVWSTNASNGAWDWDAAPRPHECSRTDLRLINGDTFTSHAFSGRCATVRTETFRSIDGEKTRDFALGSAPTPPDDLEKPAFVSLRHGTLHLNSAREKSCVGGIICRRCGCLRGQSSSTSCTSIDTPPLRYVL